MLHGLIERVGNQGVHTYTDLRSYLPDVSPQQRRKRVLAANLPHRPGVYLFRGPANEVLYVGTAVDLRRRAGQYFNGSDSRPRIKEMVALATALDHVECAHDLEAGVRELRLLAAHAPPYNRRSKFPQRWWWIVLTDEAFPRLSIVRIPKGDSAVGPFRSRADAVETADLLARFTGLRTCTARIARSAHHGPACPERELSPCPAQRDVAAADYAEAPRRAAALIDGLEDDALSAVHRPASRELAGRNRYETAARLRDHAAAAIDVLWRGQRLRALAVGHRTRRRAPRWQRRMASRRGPVRAVGRRGRRATGRTADAGCRRDKRCGTSDSAASAPLGGALVEEVGADHALAGPARCAHRAGRARLGVIDRVRGPVGVVGCIGALGAAGRRADPRLVKPAE